MLIVLSLVIGIVNRETPSDELAKQDKKSKRDILKRWFSAVHPPSGAHTIKDCISVAAYAIFSTLYFGSGESQVIGRFVIVVHNQWRHLLFSAY